MNKLVVLSGVPGSGKSYLSSTLKKLIKSHLYIISSDDLRTLITGNPQDLSLDPLMWKIYYQIAEIYSLDKDGIVILDSTNFSSERRIKNVSELKKNFDHTILVSFDINEEVVLNQNLQREHPLPPLILQEYIKVFESPTPQDESFFDDIVVIHSNDMSEAITKILGSNQSPIIRE